MQTVIFFDLETGGLSPYKHPIIQLHAAAVRWDDLETLETLECKVKFDVSQCEQEALNVNHYHPLAWELAPPIEEVLADFAALMKRHACIQKVSKAGKPYAVAKLAAYNASFDMEFLKQAFKLTGIFMPAEYHGLCVMQRAMWFFAENVNAVMPPMSWQLSDVCAALGVGQAIAHEATGDNLAQIGVLRRIRALDGMVAR